VPFSAQAGKSFPGPGLGCGLGAGWRRAWLGRCGALGRGPTREQAAGLSRQSASGSWAPSVARARAVLGRIAGRVPRGT
jgi:hypothetical protein